MRIAKRASCPVKFYFFPLLQFYLLDFCVRQEEKREKKEKKNSRQITKLGSILGNGTATRRLHQSERVWSRMGNRRWENV